MTIVQGRRCNALIHASTARSAGDHGRGRGMGRGGTVQAARQNLVGRKNERSEQRRYAIQSDTVSISQSVSVRRSFSEPPTQEASHVLKMTSQTYPPGPEDRRAGSELKFGPEAVLPRIGDGQLGGREILDRQTERLEQGQLALGDPAGVLAREIGRAHV